MRNPLGRNLRVAGVITAVTGGLIAGITPAQAGTPLNTTGIPTRYTAEKLDWRQCAADEVNLPAGAPSDLVKALQCATFGTPRDWDHPGQGPDLTIAVSRLAATGTATDSVITNPGGPGEPGRWFPIALAGQTTLREHQEVIGLDVRGTGKSTTISCGDDGADLAKLDPRDRDPANLNRILDQNAAFAQACRQDNGSLLPLIDTYQTVRDIDLLRVLLGRQKVNYVGYSGGTWLGSHYAQTFPQRTGHFVLDSNTEFTASWQQSFGWQPLGIERRWREDYLPWLAKYDAKYHFGATADVAHQTYEDLRGALSRAPLDLGDGATYGPSDLDFGVVGAMGVKAIWPTFADTLVNVRIAADPAASEPAKAAARAAIKAGLPKPDDNADALAATEFATRCNDTRFVGGDRASLIRTSQRLLDQGLTIYGGNQLNQPCAFWPSHPKPAPAMTGRGVPPVLMVAADRDPWTPIEGVRNAHAAFQHSRLLTVTGEGDHGVYALTGNTAVDNIVNNFLVDGVLPPDESVPGMPLPTP